jgi:DNA-binding response OmpR family regulator
MKILIIEDDTTLKEELKLLLTNAGYNAETLKNFKNAVEEIKQNNPDLILLDINIPYINGELLLQEIRKEMNTPVIMVTSRVNETDELISMSYGADDYITKPYNPNILLLRINAILKRLENKSEIINYENLIVNIKKGTISLDGKETILTKNEMIIFTSLINHKKEIVTRDELMTELWGLGEYINDNALTVNISRLRTKLNELGLNGKIETRKGQGYILL